MKKIYIPLISLIAIIALLLIGLMVSMMNSGSWSSSWNFSLGGSLEIVSDKTYSSDGIDNIDIDVSYDSLEIFQNDTEEIHVIEYMSRTPEDDELAVADTSQNTFRLYKRNRNFIGINFSLLSKIEVYLPKSYLKNLEVKTTSGSVKLQDDFALEDCKLSSSSGSIRANQIKADKVEMYTTSGSIKAQDTINSKDADFKSSSGSISLYDITSQTIDAETTSGSIHSDNTITADKADFESSSGSIRLNDVLSEEVDASTTSGSINFNNVTGIQNFSSSSGSISADRAKNGGSYETTSGTIRLNFDDVTDNITCSSSSGNVRIDIPNDESFNFKGKTSSGSIRTFFENFSSSDRKKDRTAKVGENPEFDININTASGGISVD